MRIRLAITAIPATVDEADSQKAGSAVREAYVAKREPCGDFSGDERRTRCVVGWSYSKDSFDKSGLTVVNFHHHGPKRGS